MLRTILQAAALIVVLGGAGIATHALAPYAAAEYPPAPINTEYQASVGRARAAAIGNIAIFGHDASGSAVVRSVYVDHGFRIPRSNIHGTFLPGSCLEPFPTPGARILVLLGVLQPGATRRIDLYFTVGVSVSGDVAADVGSDLPDTATEPALGAGPAAHSPDLPGALLSMAALGFVLGWRRFRRVGARPPTPRPRTRAA